MYLYPHKDEWQTEFENERALILAHYDGSIDIFHIGSTAIKGLYAKDCIDILAIVDNISHTSSSGQKLSRIGYTARGEYGIPGRAYYAKNQRKVHLHVFQSGDVNIKKHLDFIRVMKGNKGLISELNQLKQTLHSKYPNDKEAYQKEKSFFYHRIVKIL